MKKALLVLFLATIFASCSDDNGVTADVGITQDTTMVNDTTTDSTKIDTSLVDTTVSDTNIQEVMSPVYTLLTDYVSNSMSEVTLSGSSLTLVSNSINISNDPRGYYENGTTYILSRGFTAASILKIANDEVALEKALPLTNPHDISFKVNSFYTTMYDNGLIYEISKTDLSILDTIVIPVPADTSNPAPSASIIVGGKLYVSQQFQKNWNATRNGQVLIIDIATNTIVDSINLLLTNPYSDFVVSADSTKLYINCGGNLFVDGDGGIEEITLATKAVVTLENVSADPDGILEMDKNGDLYYTSGYYGALSLNKYNIQSKVSTKLNPTQTKGVNGCKVVDNYIYVGYSAYDAETYSSYSPELSVLDLLGNVIATDASLTLPLYSFVK